MTRKFRPQMGIIFLFPLGLHWFSRGGCAYGAFLVIEPFICAKNKSKNL
jgi:hypothetical protein